MVTRRHFIVLANQIYVTSLANRRFCSSKEEILVLLIGMSIGHEWNRVSKSEEKDKLRAHAAFAR